MPKKPTTGRIKKKTNRFNKKALILGSVLAVVIIGGSAAAFLSMGQNKISPTQNNELNDIAKKITQPGQLRKNWTSKIFVQRFRYK